MWEKPLWRHIRFLTEFRRMSSVIRQERQLPQSFSPPVQQRQHQVLLLCPQNHRWRQHRRERGSITITTLLSTISEHNRAKASIMEIPKNGHLLLATMEDSPRRQAVERRCGFSFAECVCKVPYNLYLPTSYQGEKNSPLSNFDQSKILRKIR